MASALQPDLPRHGQEDAPGLGLFFFDQPDQLVVLLDGLERLQVNRLAAGAGAMHHSGNAPLMLRLDRDDEALPAYGDQIFLGAAAFREPAQGAAQALFNRSLLALDLAADPPQIGRRVVAQRAIGFSRDRSERASCANWAPAGNWLSAFSPASCAATASGGRSMSACQVVMLSTRKSRSRISSGSSKAPWMRALSVMRVGSNKPPSAGEPLAQQQAHLAHQVVLLFNPGKIARGFMASSHSRATREWQSSPPAPAAAPFERLAAAFFHHRRNWL
jgi:hypothetical protein